MARPEGLEPPTPRFEAWYSIQLSYGRVDGRRGERSRSVRLKCTRGCKALILMGEGPAIFPGYLSTLVLSSQAADTIRSGPAHRSIRPLSVASSLGHPPRCTERNLHVYPDND